MASKDKKPKSEKETGSPDPAPEEVTRPVEEPEEVSAGEPSSSTLAPTPKPKKESSSSSGVWGILLFILLILTGGIGAGGYYLYQEQMKFQNETLAKIAQLEGQLNALDTEADLARQNKQSIGTLKQELQQFKTDMDATLKAHQSSLSTLDEDVMRLKEKLQPPAEIPPAPPSLIEGLETPAGKAPKATVPETSPKEDSKGPKAGEDTPDQESQKFVEWIENFFAAIWKWITSLFK